MDYLKEAQRRMMRCMVEWNVLEKDEESEVGGNGAAGAGQIERGMFTYAYSPELRRRLHNPAMYARLISTCNNASKANMAWRCGNSARIIWGRAVSMGRRRTFRWKPFASSWGYRTVPTRVSRGSRIKVLNPAVAEINEDI